MKRFVTILLLSAIVNMAFSCDELEFYKPQADGYFSEKDAKLFPELCYISYEGKNYAYSENPFYDVYDIHSYFFLGVDCYTHYPNESNLLLKDFSMVEVTVRAEISSSDLEHLSPGGYPADLTLDVYRYDEKYIRQKISFRDEPCTLVIDEISPAETRDFKWRIKAHITEEIQNRPVHLEFNMKFE